MVSYVFAKVAFLPTRLLAALRGLNEYNLPNMVENVKKSQTFAFLSEANITQPTDLPSGLQPLSDN